MTAASAIQSVAWDTGLQAIRDSANFTSFEAFYEHLRDGMRQNSAAVRQRYTGLIIRRLFPERSLDGLNPRVWQAYRDEGITSDLARVTTLEAEPVIADFVVNQLLPLQPGMVIDQAMLRDYISSTYGGYKRDSYTRLLSSLGKMGLVTWVDRSLVAQAVPRPTNALLILVHERLAPTPRIVRVADILEPPEPMNHASSVAQHAFWHLLGMREPNEVRSALRDAEAAGLIAKYSVVDQLEQITTRYSYDEFLAGAYRL